MRALKGKQVIGTLKRIMNGRNISMEDESGIRKCIILPTLTYTSEVETWNAAQQSKK